MFADKIERMKSDYTDKYVVVDGTRPELARFRELVGRVKTVNMSGRALVEFDDYHLNIGWYDIDPEFLKVVDKPPPKPPKAEAKKAAPKARLPRRKSRPPLPLQPPRREGHPSPTCSPPRAAARRPTGAAAREAEVSRSTCCREARGRQSRSLENERGRYAGRRPRRRCVKDPRPPQPRQVPRLATPRNRLRRRRQEGRRTCR